MVLDFRSANSKQKIAIGGFHPPCASKDEVRKTKHFTDVLFLSKMAFDQPQEPSFYAPFGGSDVQPSSQQHQQQQQQQQRMYGQQSFQQQAGNLTALAQNPFLQNYAQENLREVQARLVPGASRSWNLLRFYFHVDNRYVLRKMGLLLFPWRHRDWARVRIGDESSALSEGGMEFAPPMGDVNAPDLYLPTMASITYILFIGLLKGTKRSFNPEILQNTFSTCAVVLLLEVAAMRGGLYSLPRNSERHLASLDLVAYAGYKYVLVALNLFLGMAFGTTVYNVSMFYLCLCMAFFVYKTLEKVVPKPGHESSGHKRRLYCLIGCAVLQFLTIFFLGFTRDLGESSLPSMPSFFFSNNDEEIPHVL